MDDAPSTGRERNSRETGNEDLGPQPCDNRFEAVVHSISDGVFAVDSEWRITCFNRAAERTIGIRRAEALGRRCCDVFRSSICKDACALRYTMETGNPVVNLPIHIRDASGRIVPVTVSTALLRDRDGKVIGGVETFRDLNLVKSFLDQVEGAHDGPRIITSDPGLRKLLEDLPTIARSESTILIEGESGTGKGLLAQAIHAQSPRRDRPMVTVSCGALPDTLLESELFGYRRGAFTGADRDKPGRVRVAEAGTLFLDEIGDLPLAVQVKILRLLQDRVYEPLGDVVSHTADVRVLVATNRNLAQLVDEGRFRSDLFYRVNVIRLEMPPLRDRIADVPLLADAFLRQLSMQRGRIVEGLSRAALRHLMSHDFPGNVRELENILEHAYVLCRGARIEKGDLPDWLLGNDTAPTGQRATTLEEVEAEFIARVLARNRFNRTEAARELGMHTTTLYRKIRKLGIELPSKDGRSTRWNSRRDPDDQRKTSDE
ncbi:MAG: sigma 54-interacting transcriptional regulator [Holophagae bacterium]|jgi:PAS domain S-box-containing protein